MERDAEYGQRIHGACGSNKALLSSIDDRVGDACDLPWADKSFDIVYSNAVIEHVGDFARQQRMAREIARVGKSWFVTTPNRWYPYEFHLRLPFVTWLPFHGYRWAGAFLAYNHLSRRYRFTLSPREVGFRLLSCRELKMCFPDSRVLKLRVTFWPETLLAIGRQRAGIEPSQSEMATGCGHAAIVSGHVPRYQR